MIPFNINSFVRVKVTEIGHKQHRKLHDDLIALAKGVYWPYVPLEVDADGWTPMQLWEVMQVWGPHMGNGLPVPIETEIQFETPSTFCSENGDAK